MQYNERPPMKIIVIMFVCVFLIGLLVGYQIGEFAAEERALENYTQLKRDAVENNAAHWCVVDHEKVFSWEKCE